MSTETYTLAITPIAGKINQADSVWLGGQRFFAVFDTTGTISQNAAILDGTADLYTSSTTVTLTKNVQTSTGTAFGWPPKLFKLASNLVLCVYTTSTPTASSSSSTLINARVYAIDSSNNITIACDQSSLVPSSFLNYQVVGTVGQTVRTAFQTSSSVYYIPADNHIVFFTRDFANPDPVGGGAARYTNSFYDLSYSTSAAAITLTKRWTSASSNEITYYSTDTTSSTISWLGWWHLLSIAPIPGTTSVLVFDNGVFEAFTDQIAATALTSTANRIAYVFDYTSLGTAASTSITGIRQNSAVVPFDSTRTLELFSGTWGPSKLVTGRINTSGTWSGDMHIETSAAIAASQTPGDVAAAWALAPVQHLLVLDSSSVMVFLGYFSNASVTASGVLVLQILDQMLQVVPYGYRSPSLGFYRGNDPLVPRAFADGSSASTYDFFAQTTALTYKFLRYDNPA